MAGKNIVIVRGRKSIPLQKRNPTASRLKAPKSLS